MPTIHEVLTFYCGGASAVCDRLPAMTVHDLLEQARTGKGPLLVEEYEGGPRWVFPVESTAVKHEIVTDGDEALFAFGM
jgi:hypothetical protein